LKGDYDDDDDEIQEVDLQINFYIYLDEKKEF
jgi:hypothetical protein